MKKQLAASLLIVSLPFLFVSCVSSLLKENPPTFSQEISYTAPAAPFSKMSTPVFPSWKNNKTGNVITIVSDCNPGASFTLQGLHQMIEGSITQPQLIKEENIEFQNRPALTHRVSGQIDGLDIEVYSVSFIRRSCGYVSSLSGKKGSLDSDQQNFEQFIQGYSFE
jgi:hypothetical protein